MNVKTIIHLVKPMGTDQEIDYKNMFLNYIKKNKYINRNKTIEISGLRRNKVVELLNGLIDKNIDLRK